VVALKIRTHDGTFLCAVPSTSLSKVLVPRGKHVVLSVRSTGLNREHTGRVDHRFAIEIGVSEWAQDYLNEWRYILRTSGNSNLSR